MLLSIEAILYIANNVVPNLRSLVVMHKFKLFVLTCFFISASFVSADDGKLGRLPDGRAFRTDSQGNQLVDYIAELEINVEALTRQVRGLEDENQQKQGIIQRLQASGAQESGVTEKNLSGNGNAVAVNSKESERCKTEIIEKPCDCSSEKSKCEEKVADLQVDVDLSRKRGEEIIRLKNEYSTLEAQSASLRSDNENLQKQLTELRETREEDLRVARANATKEQTAEREVVAANTDSRASIRLEGGVKSEMPANAALNETRIQAVEVFRGRMLNDINSLQGLIAYRDRLLRETNQPAASDVAESKAQIAKLKTKIASATMVHELASVRGDVNTLRGKTQGEIAILNRQQKNR